MSLIKAQIKNILDIHLNKRKIDPETLLEQLYQFFRENLTELQEIYRKDNLTEEQKHKVLELVHLIEDHREEGWAGTRAAEIYKELNLL